MVLTTRHPPRLDLAGRGFGASDVIIGPHDEHDVEAGLAAAYDWALASSPVAGTP